MDSTSSNAADAAGVANMSTAVFVRFRPFSKQELNEMPKGPAKSSVAFHKNGRNCMIKNNSEVSTEYNFDTVFHMNTAQDKVFSTVAVPMVKNFVNGYSCTLLCFGAANTGKSYTAFGPHPSFIEAFEHKADGVIQRIVRAVYDKISADKSAEYTVKLVCFEVDAAQNKIVDLQNNSSADEYTIVKEDSSGEFKVQPPLAEETTANIEAFIERLMKAVQRRQKDSKQEFTSTIFFEIILSKKTGSAEPVQSRLSVIDVKSFADTAFASMIESLGKGNAYEPSPSDCFTALIYERLARDSLNYLIAHCSPHIPQAETSIQTMEIAKSARGIVNTTRVTTETLFGDDRKEQDEDKHKTAGSGISSSVREKQQLWNHNTAGPKAAPLFLTRGPSIQAKQALFEHQAHQQQQSSGPADWKAALKPTPRSSALSASFDMFKKTAPPPPAAAAASASASASAAAAAAAPPLPPSMPTAAPLSTRSVTVQKDQQPLSSWSSSLSSEQSHLIDKLQKELSDLKEREAKWASEKESLMEEVDSFENVINNLRAENRGHKQVIEDLRQKEIQSQADKAALSAVLRKVRPQLKQIKEHHCAMKRSITELNQSHAAAISEIVEKYAGVSQELTAVQGALKQKEQKLRDMASSISMRDSLAVDEQKRISLLEKLLAEREQENKKLSQALREAQSKLNDQQTQINLLTKTADRNKEIEEENRMLKSQLEVKLSEIDETAHDLNELIAAAQQQGTASAPADAAAGTRQEGSDNSLKQQVNKLGPLFEFYERRYKALEGQFSALQTKLSETEAKHRDEVALLAAQAEQQRSNALLDELSREQSSTIARMKEEMLALQDQLEARQGNEADLLNRIKTLQEERALLHGQISAKDTDMLQLKTVLAEAQKQKEMLTMDLELAKAASEQSSQYFKTTIEEKDKLIADQTELIQKLYLDIHTAKTEKQHLAEELEQHKRTAQENLNKITITTTSSSSSINNTLLGRDELASEHKAALDAMATLTTQQHQQISALKQQLLQAHLELDMLRGRTEYMDSRNYKIASRHLRAAATAPNLL